MITILSSTRIERLARSLSLRPHLAILHTLIRSVYFIPLSAGLTDACINQQALTINIADYAAAVREKVELGLDASARSAPLRIVKRFIGIYISRTVTPTL